MKKILIALSVILLTACGTVQTPSGPITWIKPIPSGTGPATATSGGGHGVGIYSGTVISHGVATGYSVVVGK